MEQIIDTQELLEQIMCPVFIVKDGIIIQANHAALQRQIEPGTAIQDILFTGQQEYNQFTEGGLCLALCVGNITYTACVVKKESHDVFYLESDYSEPELRAFALASQALRESLGNAMTSADMMLPDTQSSPELKQQLLEISRNLHQLHRAICNMSDAASYGNNRPARVEYRDLASVVDEILEKAQTLVAKTGRTLKYNTLNQSVYSLIDAEKLERAILNLISNAVKYGRNDAPIRVTVEQQEGRFRFSVQNPIDGIGASAYKNLFSYFLREPGIENSRSGIGLGMTIVRSAAMAHEGTVLFDQPAPDCIRFTLSIPIRKSTEYTLRSPVLLPVDYAGGYDHALTELSDILPADLFE